MSNDLNCGCLPQFGEDGICEYCLSKRDKKPLPTVPVGATCVSCRYFGEKLTKEKTMATLCFAEPMIIYRDAIDLACHRYQEAAK